MRAPLPGWRTWTGGERGRGRRLLTLAVAVVTVVVVVAVVTHLHTYCEVTPQAYWLATPQPDGQKDPTRFQTSVRQNEFHQDAWRDEGRSWRQASSGAKAGNPLSWGTLQAAADC